MKYLFTILVLLAVGLLTYNWTTHTQKNHTIWLADARTDMDSFHQQVHVEIYHLSAATEARIISDTSLMQLIDKLKVMYAYGISLDEKEKEMLTKIIISLEGNKSVSDEIINQLKYYIQTSASSYA